jgi:hypothetical protein
VAAGLEPGVESAFESAAEIALELGEAGSLSKDDEEETSGAYVFHEVELSLSSDLTNNFLHNGSP